MKLNKILTISTLLLASACDVTDIAPANRIPEDVAFGDPQRVQAAVVGAYEAAQQGFYLGAVQRGYPFGAASTEQGDLKGEDMYNDQLFYEVTYTGAWTTTTANNNGMWISLYRLINRCNVVIEGVARAKAAGTVTAAEADQYTGEMLFLRALSHHELLIHFSRPYSDDPSKPGVPYHDFAIDDATKVEAGLAIPRGTVLEGYTKLLADLDLAETLMTDAGTVPFRARKGAAIALKTRVKLHMEDWDGVMTEFAKIATRYSLTASPDGPFTSRTSTESIFSLQHSNVSNPGVNGALANMYGSPSLGARGLVKISPVIWAQPFWLAGDTRRTLLTTQVESGIYSYKYRAFGVNDDPTPIIRFAEVILNAAEAEARLNNLDNARILLNRVRDRAAGVANTYDDVAEMGGTQSAVLQVIWNETRIEFLGEGRRWSNIHRLAGEGVLVGIPGKAQTRSVSALTQYATVPSTLAHTMAYTSDLFIWPIPLSETLVNSTLAAQQNPGY